MSRIKSRRPWRRITAAALGLTLLAAFPTEARKTKNKKIERSEDSAASKIPAIAGPKRTVAVADFDASTTFLEQYGEVDIGGGLAAMLATALVDSGQFIVVERAEFGAVRDEQELAATSPIAAEQGGLTARLSSAQLLIVGSVTEFNQAAKRRGFFIGVGGLGLSPRSETGTVALDIRVVDTLTSEVVSSYVVRESIKTKTVDLSFSDGKIDLSQSNFHETPVGQAARKAIDSAIQRFATEAAARPWTGQVVDFDDDVVAINAGANAGIQAGDSFGLHRVTKVLTDPVSGRIIGRRQQALGTVVINVVDENVAFGSFLGDSDEPQRGDLVAQR